MSYQLNIITKPSIINNYLGLEILGLHSSENLVQAPKLSDFYCAYLIFYTEPGSTYFLSQ